MSSQLLRLFYKLDAAYGRSYDSWSFVRAFGFALKLLLIYRAAQEILPARQSSNKTIIRF